MFQKESFMIQILVYFKCLEQGRYCDEFVNAPLSNVRCQSNKFNYFVPDGQPNKVSSINRA